MATGMLERLGGLIGMSGTRLRDVDIMKICLGGDNFGIFEGRSKNWSMGAIFIAPDDVPLDVKWKREYHWPLMIFPGPNQPKTMQPLARMIVQELQAYAPTADGTGSSVWVSPNSEHEAYDKFRTPDSSKFVCDR